MRPHRFATTLPLMLVVAASAACTSSSNFLEPEPEEPEVEQPGVRMVARDALPGFATDLYKATCQTSSGECPVVQWQDVDYVALSFHDNRSAFAIHAFDAAGSTLGVTEAVGARYLNDIVVDVDARTVAFVGQDERTVTLTWDDLATIR
ncbi:MAG: hypothetical protein RLN75_01465 [Longimicrobiales bacterium]